MRQTARMWTMAGLTLAAIAGCNSHDQDYRTQRPPVDELSPGDRGLQSKDVLVASDQMAMDLLSLPEVNQSRRPLRIVVAPVKDDTIGHRGRVNYDIFIERLKTNLSQQSGGRVRLVENRDTFNTLRDRELEGGPAGDDFGQGDGGGSSAPRPQNPDFALYGTARDLPNRTTTYYQIEFSLTDLRSRDNIWSRVYEVKTSR